LEFHLLLVTLSLPKGELLVYPNPSSDILNVQSEQNLELVQLMQLDGRLIRTERANGSVHQLNVADLKQGVYLILVETETGRSISRVVVR